MKNHDGWLSIALVALVCCASPPPTAKTTPPPKLGLGIDERQMDPGVRPQDDTYRFVNGTWLATAQIPPDKPSYGTFDELQDEAEADVHAIIEEIAASDPPRGTEEQQIGDFYRAYMNTELIAQQGMSPIEAEMGRIEAISNHDDLIRYLGHLQRIGLPNPFAFFVQPDMGDATRYAAYVWQSGLGLPDREYYFDEEFAEVRSKYVAYIADLLALAKVPDAGAKAAQIMALETRLATAHWDKLRNRDPVETYNVYTISEANFLTPNLDWGVFLRSAGVAEQTEIILSQPSYLEEAARALEDEAISSWKTYFVFKLIDGTSPYLTEDYVNLNFDFAEHTLSGTEQIRPRWKRAVEATNAAVGESVGKKYVARRFPPGAKARMDEMISNLRLAFQLSIDQLDWMGPQTKAQAQDKLRKFTPKIGYPSRWRDYSSLEIRPDDLLGNVLRAYEFEFQRNADKLGKPIDRSEWWMTPQTVNAYYDATMNEIVFPAAILRPPFFDVAADDATNYGAIGAVIGHEFSHGFDDEGRKFDGDGNLRDWWTEQDDQRFRERAARLGEQYDGYEPIDDMHVDGAFTMGENIGDLAGLTMAYRAYQLSLDGKRAPVIDGFTGDQRFFMGWAQIWRALSRDDELRLRLKADPHAPEEYRTNGTLVNIDAFHEAFGTQPGDDMWKAPEERVRIW